jgi:transcriptional regulator with XRE-family HTH domain
VGEPSRVHTMIAKALDVTTGDLRELAAEVGVSYDTLWAWKSGRRNPSPENLARLADALHRRGGELQALAEELRKEAGE